jgi:hypothetical protein
VSPAHAATESDAPLNDLQRELLELARLLPAPEPAAASLSASATQSEAGAGAYARAKMDLWLQGSDQASTEVIGLAA